MNGLIRANPNLKGVGETCSARYSGERMTVRELSASVSTNLGGTAGYQSCPNTGIRLFIFEEVQKWQDNMFSDGGIKMNEIIISPPGHELKYKYFRETCRALIIRGDEILMSHERIPDCRTLPGGGIEQGEDKELCCKREVLEETGYIVSVNDFFITVNEYYGDARYTHHYYFCDIIGEGEASLTEYEKSVDARPEWIKIDKLMARFEEDFDKEGENHRVHLRDHSVLKEY